MPEPGTPYGRSLLEVESIVAGVGCGRRSRVHAALAAPVVGPHVPSPVGRLFGCRLCRFPRSPIRRSRSCIPTTPPVRWSPRSTVATTARSTSSARARRRRGRRCGSAAGCRCRCSARCGKWRGAVSWSWPAPRSRRTSSSCCGTVDGRGNRAVESLGLAASSDADGAPRPLRVGRRHPDPHQPGGGRMTSIYRLRRPRSASSSRRSTDRARRLAGGRAAAPLRRPLPDRPVRLDPQLVDLVAPVFTTAFRVEVFDGENLPARPGGAIANRGFGMSSRRCSGSRCAGRCSVAFASSARRSRPASAGSPAARRDQRQRADLAVPERRPPRAVRSRRPGCDRRGLPPRSLMHVMDARSDCSGPRSLPVVRSGWGCTHGGFGSAPW